MRTEGIIKEIMQQKELSQRALATRMGASSQQVVGNMLKRENGMRIDNFLKILNSMGAKVVVQYDDREWEVTTDEN